MTLSMEGGAVLARAHRLALDGMNWWAAQPPDEYPNLVALAGHLAHPDQERRFEVGLQILLDGLERRLAASGSSAPS